MVHTAVIYCQTLDKDLNNYENKLFTSRNTTFMLLLSFTLYLQLRLIKSNNFGQEFIFISSTMGIYVLQTMFGKGNCLTVSKLQTSCFYRNYFKNYKLLNMITPQKW